MYREEWDFWSCKPERLRPNDAYDEEFRKIGHTIPHIRLSQLKNTLELVEAETEIVLDVRIMAAPGHTPGYVVIAISSGDEQLFSIGDLIYDPKDIESAVWYSVFDFDTKQVILTRRRIFEQASSRRALLMAYHLPFPGPGYVSPYRQGWHWQPYQETA